MKISLIFFLAIILVPPRIFAEEKKSDEKRSSASSSAARIGIDETIPFSSNQFEIPKDSLGTMDAVIAKIRSLPKSHLGADFKIIITGHADFTEKNPVDLSLRRAESVRDYFLKKGMDRAILGVKNYGSERPIATNQSEEGRAKNRRVEFSVQDYHPPLQPGMAY